MIGCRCRLTKDTIGRLVATLKVEVDRLIPVKNSHLQHLRIVFETLKQHKLFVKKSKCSFGQARLEYFGHVVSSEGVSADKSKIDSMLSWPQPTTVKGLRGFLDSFTWNEEAARAFSRVLMHTKSLSQVLSEVVLVLVHLCLDMIYHVTYATFVLRVIAAHVRGHLLIHLMTDARPLLLLLQTTDLLDHLPSGIKERASREPLCDLPLAESPADVALVLLPYRGLPFPNESFIQVVTLAKALRRNSNYAADRTGIRAPRQKLEA
ncbi:hypothetical protein Tco_0032104 [Tanacetum coccineum]